MKKAKVFTADDEKRFKDLDKVIVTGTAKLINAGFALKEIRNKKLYKERCTTFEEYIKKTFGLDIEEAEEYIKMAEASIKVA